MVGVVTSLSGNAALSGWSFDLRLVALLRMICSTGESLLANSCGLSFGGGRNGDPGDGNGEVEGGTDNESRGASAGQRRVRWQWRHARVQHNIPARDSCTTAAAIGESSTGLAREREKRIYVPIFVGCRCGGDRLDKTRVKGRHRTIFHAIIPLLP